MCVQNKRDSKQFRERVFRVARIDFVFNSLVLQWSINNRCAIQFKNTLFAFSLFHILLIQYYSASIQAKYGLYYYQVKPDFRYSAQNKIRVFPMQEAYYSLNMNHMLEEILQSCSQCMHNFSPSVLLRMHIISYILHRFLKHIFRKI